MSATLPFPRLKIKNNARGQLVEGIDDIVTTFSVMPGQGANFSTDNFVVRLGAESMLVGTRTADTFSSVTRGWGNTIAAPHDITELVRGGVDAGFVERLWDSLVQHQHDTMDDVVGLTAALAGKSATGHGHAQADVTGLVAALDAKVDDDDVRLVDARVPLAHSHPQADVTGLVTALAAKEATANKNQASGYAGLDAGSKIAGSQQVYGSIANTACQGNDARLSDARAPTSHQHNASDINAGTIAAGRLGSGTPTSAEVLYGDSVWRTAPGGGANPWLVETFLASDVSTAANVTPVNLTGLVFTFIANARYIIELFAVMQSPVATTGYGLQLDVSVAVTLATMTFFHQLANTGTLSGGSSIADDASVGVSSGVPSAAINLPLYGAGILIAGGTGGTAQLRLRSETTAIATMKANSIFRVRKVGG